MEFPGKTSIITPEGVFIIGTCDENGAGRACRRLWEDWRERPLQRDRSGMQAVCGGKSKNLWKASTGF